MLKRWNDRNLIVFTDISADAFSAERVGKTMEELMKSIHGRTEDGTWCHGVEVFRQLYRRVGFRRSVSFSRLPFVRHSLDLLYRMFASLRYRSAIRRMRRKQCDNNTCKVPGE